MDTNGHAEVPAPSQRLLRRLDDPATAAALERLLDRLDLVALTVDSADEFLRRGDQLTDNIAEALSDARAATPQLHASALAALLPRMAAAAAKLANLSTSPAISRLLDSGLLDRLAAPDTLASLQTIVDKLPLMAFAATAAEEFLRRGEELADNLAGSVREAQEHFTSPIDPHKLYQAAEGLPKVIDAGVALIRAGLFDPEIIDVLVEVGKQAAGSYREAKQLPDRPVGAWGLYQALRDPEVQRAIGVGLHVVKRFGRTFNRSEVSPPERKTR